MVFDTAIEEEIQQVSAQLIGYHGHPFRFVDYCMRDSEQNFASCPIFVHSLGIELLQG